MISSLLSPVVVNSAAPGTAWVQRKHLTHLSASSLTQSLKKEFPFHLSLISGVDASAPTRSLIGLECLITSQLISDKIAGPSRMASTPGRGSVLAQGPRPTHKLSLLFLFF